MWQMILVVALIAASAIYVVWALLPARRRYRLLVAAANWSANKPALSVWRARLLVPRIERATHSLGACGSCSAAGSHHGKTGTQ
jgi:hypothetical protein